MLSCNHLIPLPWHSKLWKEYYDAAKASKLHHALLIQGSSGSGKTDFIKAFVELLLCMDPTWLADEALYRSCEKCRSCLWYRANTHPNHYKIIPKLSSANKYFISIDQIRHLTQFLQNTAMHHSVHLKRLSYHTIVVIDPVDVLQISAVHALLKTLEEPTLGVLFILASSKPQTLASTIKSRCQSIVLPESVESVELDWLKSELSKANLNVDESLVSLSLEMANGMPLKALSYLKTNEIEAYQLVTHSLISLSLKTVHPGEIVQKWASYPIEQVLDYLMLAISQFVRFKLEEDVRKNNLNVSTEVSNQFFEYITLKFLFLYWDKVSTMRYEMSLYNLNPTLALESLAYTFSNSCSLS